MKIGKKKQIIGNNPCSLGKHLGPIRPVHKTKTKKMKEKIKIEKKTWIWKEKKKNRNEFYISDLLGSFPGPVQAGLPRLGTAQIPGEKNQKLKSRLDWKCQNSNPDWNWQAQGRKSPKLKSRLDWERPELKSRLTDGPKTGKAHQEKQKTQIQTDPVWIWVGAKAQKWPSRGRKKSKPQIQTGSSLDLSSGFFCRGMFAHISL